MVAVYDVCRPIATETDHRVSKQRSVTANVGERMVERRPRRVVIGAKTYRKCDLTKSVATVVRVRRSNRNRARPRRVVSEGQISAGGRPKYLSRTQIGVETPLLHPSV